ncbi:hypothetical protein [Kitasatospora sp. NBC_01539]|uniref:hypothetical protein n=1 Tax=Kitasatospora sp. NBC_01539 TaxID=2903577 RepID=UPI00386026BA
MRRTRARIIGLATAVSSIALGGSFAAPAHAADLALDAPAAVSVIPRPATGDAVAKPVTLNLTGTVAKGQHAITYTFDASGLAGLAELDPNLGGSACTSANAVFTCTSLLYSQDGKLSHQVSPELTAVKGAALGSTGHLLVTEATDAGTVTADVLVSVGGPDLRISTDSQLKGLKPGSSVTPVLKIVNQGSLPSGRLVLVFDAIAGLTIEHRFANCEYASGAGAPELAICTINTSVAPGETVTIDPVRLGVGSDALKSWIDVTAFPGESDQTARYRARLGFEHGSGPARLTAGRAESEDTKPGPPNATRYDENMVSIAVEVDNTADFSAIGAWVPGTGDHVGRLTAGLRNSGPGHLLDRSGGEAAPNVRVVLPAGTVVTGKPAGCESAEGGDHLTWSCTGPWDVPAGFQKTFDFELRTTGTGPVAVVSLQNTRSDNEPGHPSAVMPWDPHPDNDLTRVTLGAAPDGQVPAPGTSPSTSASASPTGSASPSASATPSPSASASGSAGAGSGTGGGLAFTGASAIGPMVGIGTGAVAVGGTVLLLARRRRAGSHG